MHSNDGGLNWENPQKLAFDNLVFGPGHGIQKQLEPASGRLVIPGNRKGSSQVMISDDHGETWQVGAALSTGNENEIAELSDGRQYLGQAKNGCEYTHANMSWLGVALRG